jgi:hypothetical protein
VHRLVHNFCASTSSCLAIVVAWLRVEPVAFYDLFSLPTMGYWSSSLMPHLGDWCRGKGWFTMI